MLIHKKRFIIVTLMILTLVVSFGYFSRYPDLNRKAMVAENHTVADTISMWPILKITASDPTWKKIAYTSVNWANDNKKGMAFGIILAALLSCWLSYFQFNPKGRLRSAFYGMVLGSPLGVCVNCAAPVFKGALASKRIEMALALMFASPTLNVVVLTMAFSLLPFYMAVTKLLFNLAVILIGVPLLARWLADAPIKDLNVLDERLASPSCPVPTQESITQASLGLLRDFWQKLSWIFLRTAPLMLVAGCLGATISHLVPLDALQGQGSFVSLLIAASVGLFLPVPMAFDVVLTNALFSAGLPANVALVLLLSLGVYSFYSFMITWQSASRKWALLIATGLWLVIVPIGSMAPWLHETFYLNPNVDDYRRLSQAMSVPAASTEATQLTAKVTAAAKPFAPAEVLKVDGQTIKRWPFFAKGAENGRFVQHEGTELGLNKGFMYTIRDYPDPFWIGRGTAAGDFDQDGWIDVVFGSDQGPKLYRNIGGQFTPVTINLDGLKDLRIFAVALIDFDNDGWLDLFMSSFHRGNFWLKNQKGQFSTQAESLPNGDAILTVAPAFADLDADGRVDIYNGNMALGIATGFRAYGKPRQNGIAWNRPGGFVWQAMQDEEDGETMASLISDINGDGRLDLYENNDFIIPDYLYFGTADRQLKRLKAPGIKQFATPYFSMSVDTADINNDLRMDLLVTGTIATKQDLGTQAIDGVQATEYKKAKDSIEYCNRIKDPDYRLNCQKNRRNEHLIPFHRLKNLKVSDCLNIPAGADQDSCLLSMMWMIVTNNDDNSDCKQRYGFDAKVLEVCQIMRGAGPLRKRGEFDNEAPQIDRAVLYLGQADGGLGRAKADQFDHPGGWTWSSRFADLDNDGWQDIFNAEGAVRKGEYGWNVFLRNEQGKFSQKQFSAGLSNDFNLFSFVLIDYDHDGDLDIIGNGSDGPPQIYENQIGRGQHSIAFKLEQKQSNTAALNARIIIHPSSGSAQVRELKAGGGYQSFDAPLLYFGLGQAETVDAIEIIWPDGKQQKIKGPFAADALYGIQAAS